MCNFSQGVWDKAVEAGRKEGMEVGIKEGAAQAMLDCIRNLMKNTGWPIEQAMTALKVPETDWPKYQELLGGQE